MYSLKAVREMPEACTGSGGGIGAPASERAVALAPSDLEREKIRERMLNKGGSKKRKRRNAEKAAAVKAKADRGKKAKSGAGGASTFKSANELFTQGYGLGVGK